MIFKMLPPRDLANCRVICRQWNLQIQEDKPLMRRIWSKITAESCIREARNGNIKFFSALTEFATDANPADKWGGTPLHTAALYGHLEVVRLILDSVEDKNPVDNRGLTPLHHAAREGYLEVVHLLLDSVVDKSPADNAGQTPLQEATRGGHSEVVDLIQSYL